MYSLRFLGWASFFATSCIFSRSFRARSSGPVDVPLHLSPQVCHRACQQLRCLVCVEDGRQGYRPATVERLEFMQKKRAYRCGIPNLQLLVWQEEWREWECGKRLVVEHRWKKYRNFDISIYPTYLCLFNKHTNIHDMHCRAIKIIVMVQFAFSKCSYLLPVCFDLFRCKKNL